MFWRESHLLASVNLIFQEKIGFFPDVLITVQLHCRFNVTSSNFEIEHKFRPSNYVYSIGNTLAS